MSTRPSIPRFRDRDRRDADEPLAVTIKVADAVAGVPRDPDNCVLALATKRRRAVIEAVVGAGFVYVRYHAEPETWVRYALTARGRRQVHSFDENPDAVHGAAEWIAGQTVELQPAPVSKRLGYKRGQHGTNRREGRAPNLHRAPSLRNVTLAPFDQAA